MERSARDHRPYGAEETRWWTDHGVSVKGGCYVFGAGKVGFQVSAKMRRRVNARDIRCIVKRDAT